MTYQETTDFLFNLQSFGIKLGLERMTAFLEAIGNPQKKFQSIHIAGTNGKGSTSAFLESILRHAGKRTGLYTSPHLVKVEERIKIDAVEINQDDFIKSVEILLPHIKYFKTTFFETLTALAFYYFAQKNVEIAVVEVGLGGRLDATNVIQPLQTLITSISFDHQHILGQSLEKITREKAGILKQNVACITNNESPQVLNILKNMCVSLHSEFFHIFEKVNLSNIKLTSEFSRFDFEFEKHKLSKVQIPLAGENQLKNAALAICSALLLSQVDIDISIEDLYTGMRNAYWPARLQLVKSNPRVVIDVAHNSDGISSLVSNLQKLYEFENLICIFGVMKDKDYRSMLTMLSSVTNIFIFVTPNYKRALPAETLAEAATDFSNLVKIYPTIDEAFEYAMSIATKEDLICVTGSHFTVGELISPLNCKRYDLKY